MRVQLTKEGRAALDLGVKCLPAVSIVALCVIGLAIVVQGMKGCIDSATDPPQPIVFPHMTSVVTQHSPPKTIPQMKPAAAPAAYSTPAAAPTPAYKLYPGYDPDPSRYHAPDLKQRVDTPTSLLDAQLLKFPTASSSSRNSDGSQSSTNSAVSVQPDPNARTVH